MMKVFTVGLDQKPAAEEAKTSPEKSDSPPPGYSTTEARIPLPMGPELPRPPLPPPPPQPILMRKSRGYKGILLVMLAVFLMAVFALTLSEMAYNRQREENFFKLRWAELKHRLGYETDGPFDYYQRAIGEKFDRLLSLAKSGELPLALSAEQEPSTTSTTTASSPSPTPEPIVAIDAFPPAPGSSSSSGSKSSSQQSSAEVEPPQPPPLLFGNSFAGGNNPFGQLRDARLQFLRNILQKIKQHAEDIGFDGTMQVSIVEVEPQNGAEGSDSSANDNNNNGMNWTPQRPMGNNFPPQLSLIPTAQHFFPHPRPLIDDFKNSRSFLDGFGEFHQPTFMQNNQVVEPEERPRMFGPWAQQQQQQNMPNDFPQAQQQQQPDMMENMPRWPRPNPFFRQQPEMLFFHPIFPQQLQQLHLRFPPPPPPPATNEWTQQQQSQQNGALPRPSAFDRWNGPQQSGIFPQQQQQQMMGVDQPQQQQQQVPQHQQVQIDFPEVKLPPPIISDNKFPEASEDKFPLGPPSAQNQQQQPQNQQNQQQQSDEQQPQQQLRWMPKWVGDSLRISNDIGNEQSQQQPQQQQQAQPSQPAQQPQVFGVGPPAVQPPQTDAIKFPQVTVVEPAKVADNSNNNNEDTAASTTGATQAPPAESEKKETDDEIVDVNVPQPIVPQSSDKSDQQQQQQQQPSEQQQLPETKPDQELPQQPLQQQRTGDQQQQQQPQQLFQPKWFPEVPSVFFQQANSSEEIEKTEKVFETMVENMKRMIGNMFKTDDSDSDTSHSAEVDDPNGGTSGGDRDHAERDELNVPKPAEVSSSQQTGSNSQQREQPQLTE